MSSKLFWLAPVAGAAIAIVAMAGWTPKTAPPPEGTSVGPAFALVELFTSEGCSSCPPADKVVAELHQRAQSSDRPVYLIGWHVDYWDRLGWPDPFGSNQWTARQRRYQEALKTHSLFTPQVLINGQNSMVGSRKGRVRQAISDALEVPATVKLEASYTRQGEQCQVRYAFTGAPPGAHFLVAVVDLDRESHVKKGENAGKKLTHARVGRTLRTTRLAKGETTVNCEAQAGQRPELIGFVQHEPTMAVLAADRLSERR